LDVRPESDRVALADALREDGFVRVRLGGQVLMLESGPLPVQGETTIDVIVDRLVRGSETAGRLRDSIETAFEKGLGRCRVIVQEGGFGADPHPGPLPVGEGEGSGPLSPRERARVRGDASRTDASRTEAEAPVDPEVRIEAPHPNP